ncbi:unnamed protein product [Cladocopium goreaui]|uniref:Cyclic nucleotide-gated olfactory channel (Cyclic nucleotide-gated cation channel 2) (Cyclic nucleotide-gated channel alpha-2) (CNG channel alpha-2) (CNG-2) (CNG2) n=1 Tax=Cladocopium goreaui TaxID=2562237 RepID=A0A9P1FQX0_9DINO|nr:unnamed protein product [Cladocopium goreaui]
MMAVGYGDIWAKNTEERLFCIVLQLFGATAFGFILSSVTSLLESANPRANETNKRVNEIKEWCAGRRIPRHLRMAIREHTQYVLQKKSIFNEADLLSNMPTSIRMDIIQNSYSEWLRILERPFHDEDLALRMELVQLMTPQQVRCPRSTVWSTTGSIRKQRQCHRMSLYVTVSPRNVPRCGSENTRM